MRNSTERQASRSVGSALIRSIVLFLVLLPLIGAAWAPSALGAGTTIGPRPASLSQEVQPAAFGYGDIAVKTKKSTGGYLPGACYRAQQASGAYYYQTCDYMDGANDGITTIFNLPIGKWTVYMSFAPTGFYFPKQRTGIAVTDGGVTSLVFSLFCCSSEIVVRAKTSAGAYVPGACYAVHQGSSTGTQIAPTMCDYDDGKNDGKVIVSGLYVPPGQTQTWVVVQNFTPTGFTAARNRTVTMTNGATEYANFTNAVISLSPSCTYSSSTVHALGTVAFTCKGFASYQSLTPYWDGKAAGYGFCDVQGRCNGYLSVPATVAGNHTVVVKSDSHSTSSKTFTVVPAVQLSSDKGPGEDGVLVYIFGFRAGEHVTIRQQGSSTILSGPVTTSATGDATAVLIIPDGAAATLTFYAEGDQTSVAKVTFTRTGPAT